MLVLQLRSKLLLGQRAAETYAEHRCASTGGAFVYVPAVDAAHGLPFQGRRRAPYSSG